MEDEAKQCDCGPDCDCGPECGCGPEGCNCGDTCDCGCAKKAEGAGTEEEETE